MDVEQNDLIEKIHEPMVQEDEMILNFDHKYHGELSPWHEQVRC